MSTKVKGIIFLIFLGIYAFYFFVSTGINTSNDGAHVGLAKAIYYDNDVKVGKYLGSYVKQPDYAIKEGVIYSDRLPGTAALILPFFAYADLIDTLGLETVNSQHELDIVIGSLMPPLFGILSVFLLFWFYYKFLKRSLKLSLICSVIYAIGTLAMLESSHLFSHAPSLFFVSLAVLLSISDTGLKWQSSLIIIAVLLGFASLIELQNFLFFGPLMIYVLQKNQALRINKLSKLIKPIGLSVVLLSLFLLLLAYYNYFTFDDFTLKSNKYNSFFPEESSFISALSGNFFEGLDKLFTSFTNLKSYYDPEIARLNNIPGIFVTSPVMIISVIGFYFLKRKHKAEFWLLVSCILISNVIAALHVTTLVRHIYTINLLFFLPFVFAIEEILEIQRSVKRSFLLMLAGLLIIISMLRVFYSTISYWGRNFDTIFEYSEEWFIFLIANIPFLIIASLLIFRKSKLS